ncbi:MAG: TIGR02757 family protein [Spirochaetaceae bacterium]|jgi:uncharacterized protein (TIGR02757 family)|nr:TIGR02757 family protein [Spirochaetaceae bacterium]
MIQRSLKNNLDHWYRVINTEAFIPNDPVQFPHRYRNRKDIEIAAFLAATIAWGKRTMILNSCEKMFALMGSHPYDYVMQNFPSTYSPPRACIHRTFFIDDFTYYCNGLNAIYQKNNSLEKIFAKQNTVWEGISAFRNEMIAANGGIVSKHVANPAANSACKRMHLALRWLVRREGPVDLGLWKNIDPAGLYIPLDVHVGRTARQLGLINAKRQANDRKTVEELTGKLREFCPEDPIRYDFALFGIDV